MKAVIRFVPLLVLLFAIVAAYAFDLHHILSLDGVQAQKDQFKGYIDAHPYLAPLVFMGVYAASVALSLPIATVLTLLGGFLFGLVQGVLLVVVSATLGASIVFLIAKTSLGMALRDRAGDLYKRVEENLADNAVGYLLFMRLVPLFPFVAVNVAAALFNVRFRVFVLTTFFGIMPGSAVYVYFGQQLGEIDALGDLVSPRVLLAFVLLGMFALIPTLYKQFRRRKASAGAL
ncbi:MAG: TVP38/TMEM64 family protein [Alphaproteobacteria bacterium]|nr:TVP38/TMEM64 family protein [Alphaproteobacteria bacterium]